MIIGINGVIGSGKDTTGKIIQYIDWAEKANSCDLPDFEEWNQSNIHPSGYDIGLSSMYTIDDSNWQIKKFASKLKQIASLLTGIEVSKFEDQEFKKTFLPEEWNKREIIWSDGWDEQTDIFPINFDISTLKDKSDRPAYIHSNKVIQMTVREFLQKLGTEAMRDGLHTNVWVNALMSEYQSQVYPNTSGSRGGIGGNLLTEVYPNWIITDCRFPNEAQAVKDKGGIVIRINRMKSADNSKEGMYLHPSETSLDDWNFDYILNNIGDINNLISETEKMLKHFNLLS